MSVPKIKHIPVPLPPSHSKCGEGTEGIRNKNSNHNNIINSARILLLYLGTPRSESSKLRLGCRRTGTLDRRPLYIPAVNAAISVAFYRSSRLPSCLADSINNEHIRQVWEEIRGMLFLPQCASIMIYIIRPPMPRTAATLPVDRNQRIMPRC